MNLIICRELEAPFAVEITDPSKTTVSDLKTKVSGTTKITKEELILYFNDDILPDNTPLSDWNGLRGGAAVMAVVKPLKVTLQRYTSPVEVTFTISKPAIKKWSTKNFFDFCLYKGGLPYLYVGRYVFAVRGNIIEEEGKMMSQYKCFKNDLTISVTLIQPVTKLGYGDLGEFYTVFPSSFMETALDYKTGYRSDIQFLGETKDTSYRVRKNSFSHPWIMNVKLMDGKETAIKVKGHYLTPVFRLRQQISPDSIIRLTFGSTILEDWDEEGNMMLLCNYPDLHDGATLYQINLTGGIRVKYNFIVCSREVPPNNRLQAQYTIPLVENIDWYPPPEYIEIADPKTFTIKRLKNVGKIFAAQKNIKTISVAGKDTTLTTETDSTTISSLDYICDGCTIEFKFESP